MSIKDNIVFKKKELLYFCIQRLLFGFSYSLMIPIIPLYFNTLGLGTVIIGIVMSVYGVSKAFAQVLVGVICDKLGDKLILIISFGLMALVPLLYTFTNSGFMASIIYIVQGAVLGISAPATFSLLSRSLDEDKRGECTGYASAVFTLGGAIGAIIGGFIFTKLNNYKLVFYLTSIGIVLTIIFIIIKIKKAKFVNKCKKEKENISFKIKGIIETIKKEKLVSKIILLGSIALLGDFIYGAIVSIFPFYGQEVLNSTPFYTSVIISIYLFVFGIFAPLGGVTSDKIGVKKQLIISFIVMIISLSTLSMVKGMVIFTIVIIIYFLGATFLNSALQNSLLKFGENEKIKGIVFGVVGACESLGYAIAPIISSCIYELNKRYFFPILLISTVIIYIIFLVLKKKAFST